MKLKIFLTHRLQKQIIKEQVVYFSGKQFPVLFCAQLIKNLKQQYSNVKTVSLESCDWQQLQSILATTFLGVTQLLWLGDISELAAAEKKKVLAYLATYKGPHTVLCFVSDKEVISDKNVIINLDEQLQKADIEFLLQYCFQSSAAVFFQMVGQQYKQLSLETILLLGYYSTLIGSGVQEFMHDWYEKIVVPEESLFTLAQCFFARKKDLFFRLWSKLKDQYQGPFWTVFWSEQLWRATQVIELRKQQQLAAAKQMSFRLPFSFMQKDWQTITVQELKNAHQLLYEIDGTIKLGGSLVGLELLYYKFMNKQL